MPNITKHFHIDITPEQFLKACSKEEPQELNLLLDYYLLPGFLEVKKKLDAVLNDNIRSCHQCGCTDEDCSHCIEKTGAPCYWVADNLCSACANTKRNQ